MTVLGWTIGIFLALASVVYILIRANESRGNPSSSASSSAASRDPAPAYVKNVTAYKEGDGWICYFSLADASTQEIGAGGTAILTIEEEYSRWSDAREEFVTKRRLLYSRSCEVSKSDFATTTLGLGAFAHEATICSFGRIARSYLYQPPKEMTGKVTVKFEPTGSTDTLKDETSIFF